MPNIQTKEEKNKRKNNRRTRGKRKKRVQRRGYNVIMCPTIALTQRGKKERKKERKKGEGEKNSKPPALSS